MDQRIENDLSVTFSALIYFGLEGKVSEKAKKKISLGYLFL